MKLELAQIVLTEGGKDFISRSIQRFTKSRVTHALLVTGEMDAVEAHFPRVREVNLADRLKALSAANRAYVILDCPRISLLSRHRVADAARSFIGRRYDVAQLGLFALTGQFWNDGPSRLVCSRLITASFAHGGDMNLFPSAILQSLPPDFKRTENLRAGYVTPADLLKAQLVVTHFVPSSTVRTVDDFISCT
jgi:hypothetical protein